MRTAYASPRGTASPGELSPEITKTEARALVSGGYAEFLEAAVDEAPEAAVVAPREAAVIEPPEDTAKTPHRKMPHGN